MFTPSDEIIRYDGRTLAVTTRPPIQVEACRGRRWRLFGQKGWWVHLSLCHGWRVKKFVSTLSEAGVFLKHDPDHLPWLEREWRQPLPSSSAGNRPPPDSAAWSGVPFPMF